MAFSAVPTLARRFLLSKSSEGFVSFIAWVSVVGVALGVLALVVVTSVINGFEGELARVITGMNGDLVLYSRGDPVADAEKVEERVRKIVPETEAITSSFVLELMASGPAGAAGAVLQGIDLATIGTVTQIPRRLVAGRLPDADGELALGTALADRIGATVDGEIRMIVPEMGTENSDVNPGAPRVIKCKVVGLVRMGMYDYDSKFMFGALPSVQKELGQPGKVTAFNLKLHHGADTRAAADRLSDTFGYPFRAKDWSQLNKNIFYAIKLEKAVIAIILTVIVIVAAFNVVSTLMMMIHDKSGEIAILKAMGLRPGQAFRLFCLIGLGMGIVGTIFGIAGGMGLDWVIARTRLIALPADIYYIDFLPVVIRWKEVGMIGGSALLIAFVATIYPAWSVSRRQPIEGLRYE